MSAARFEFVEGATSDLSFVASGDTLNEVFSAAGQALLAATVEEPQTVVARERRSLKLEEPDLELLLVRFLNELVFLRDAELLLLRPEHVEIELNERASLRGELSGEPIDHSRHRMASEVKAATAHGLRVSKSSDGWTATATLDV